MKNRLIVVFVLIVGLHLFAPKVAAQNQAYCDVCGYCVTGSTTPVPTPGKWVDCARCVYPDLVPPATDATDLRTLTSGNGPPTPHPEYHYTALGCVSTDYRKFGVQIMAFLFSIIGGVAFLFLLYGASIIATSQANPERLNYGKRLVYGALGGLLFALFSTFLIRFISVDLLRIPGFDTTTLTVTPIPLNN